MSALFVVTHIYLLSFFFYCRIKSLFIILSAIPFEQNQKKNEGSSHEQQTYNHKLLLFVIKTERQQRIKTNF